MTLRTILALGATTLAIGTSAGAFATEATAYRYGMNLDIAQVVTVEAPATSQGHTSTAILTYRDSNGQLQAVSYSQPTTLANQN
ncbi:MULTISPECIES: DUF2790 domain-containing protein [Pseudomonas]|uniref:DUF2790 domain-containing protein n=1 Tax=Pseudomonas TaxID=286 RepID=UPI001E5E0ABA|nr:MULTISPECIES: DUF2790 domain-containing protein [Pseudomonas]MCE1118956.1 DUF2790 domain-containing protein [Pseudomonas sp. NMI795_08]